VWGARLVWAAQIPHQLLPLHYARLSLSAVCKARTRRGGSCLSPHQQHAGQLQAVTPPPHHTPFESVSCAVSQHCQPADKGITCNEMMLCSIILSLEFFQYPVLGGPTSWTTRRPMRPVAPNTSTAFSRGGGAGAAGASPAVLLSAAPMSLPACCWETP
jgi:hypothetical protein